MGAVQLATAAGSGLSSTQTHLFQSVPRPFAWLTWQINYVAQNYKSLRLAIKIAKRIQTETETKTMTTTSDNDNEARARASLLAANRLITRRLLQSAPATGARLLTHYKNISVQFDLLLVG